MLLLAVTAMAGLMLADNVLSGVDGWPGSSHGPGDGFHPVRPDPGDTELRQEATEEPAGAAAGAGLADVRRRPAAAHRQFPPAGLGAVDTAYRLGVSELLIGPTVIAVGTSLPELAATVTCALRGHTEIAIGNVIGSNLFNLLVVMAIPGIVSSQALVPAVLTRDYPAMALLTTFLAAAVYLGGQKRPAPGPRLAGPDCRGVVSDILRTVLLPAL